MSRTLHHVRVPAAERKIKTYKPVPRRQRTRAGAALAHILEF